MVKPGMSRTQINLNTEAKFNPFVISNNSLQEIKLQWNIYPNLDIPSSLDTFGEQEFLRRSQMIKNWNNNNNLSYKQIKTDKLSFIQYSTPEKDKHKQKLQAALLQKYRLKESGQVRWEMLTN